ncbi:MAG: DUF3626 domain-containing protein [Prolixibacteraceae bacterium]
MSVVNHARIALHFHPDRLLVNRIPVAKNLLQTGRYKNQYETNISADSVSAFSGGSRDNWENEIFKGAYKNSASSERPKYGSLNLTLTQDGPSPRFGSCFFLLRPEVKTRGAFSYGDSHQSPREFGPIRHMESIHAALLNDLFTRGAALGEKDTNVFEFLTLSNSLLPHSSDFSKYRKPSENLDFYIEAQVHGDISLYGDVEQLIADYLFYETKAGSELELLCEKYDIKLNWNAGLELRVEDFPMNFRGVKIPEVAGKFSEKGVLNAFLIGEASKNMNDDYESLQMLKYLWHCIVKFGREIKEPGIFRQ